MAKHIRSPRPCRASTQPGVTLVELLIVVVILGILAAFAYPSYLRQAQVAGRTDATSALLAIAAAQEKEFLKNNAYSDNLTTLGVERTEANKYKLTVELLDGGGFLAVARPNAGVDNSQVGDTRCKEFSIDHTGAKRSVGTDGENDESTAASCW